MAIAFNATTNGIETATSPLTFSHTPAGANRLLVVAVLIGSGTSSDCSGVTFKTVALTLIGSKRTIGTTGQVSLWYLINPSTGAGTVSVSFSGTGVTCDATATTYTGVQQTDQPEAIAGESGSAGNPAVTVTTVRNGSWVVGVLGNTSGPSTADLTERSAFAAEAIEASYQDTNAAVTPAGNQAVSWTDAVPGNYGLQAASFRMSGLPLPSVKTWNGLEINSVKTINGLAIASVKTWNGLA